jgi:2-C-methyl-D-erythritol 4-phosphate cytidylyltransferase/2-C-methyl-D-erythritol 4-phosphate cytidylyltransferase/2-C-methyl-D-erythritol 2,4-cyclodiphosphate synthase
MGGVKKEYRPLGTRDARGNPLTVLGAAAAAFAECPRIQTIVIAVPHDRGGGEAPARASLPPDLGLRGAGHDIRFVPGGESRRMSVHQGLALLAAAPPDYALVHDGARPWIDGDLIARVIDGTIRHGAAIPCVPLAETPKEIDRHGFVRCHLPRRAVQAAQTPQGFRYQALLSAHEKAARRERDEGVEYTDDAEVWGEFVGPVAVVAGSSKNRKITFIEDLTRGEAL